MIYTIYRLKCNVCKDFYIGQTKGTLVDRYTQHSNDANRGSKTRLHRHLRYHGLAHAKIKKLWSVNTDDVELVKDYEQFFIAMLKPKLNIAVRTVRNMGMKAYQREYRERKREDATYRCAACNLNCVSGLHLNIHYDTNKHRKHSIRFLGF